MLVDETHAVMSLVEFQELLDYSFSMPTGVVAGKRWKRLVDRKWMLGEYEDNEDPSKVDVRWREILLVG